MLQHLTSNGPRALRTWVLQGPPGEDLAAALGRTVEALLAEMPAGEVLEVFAAAQGLGLNAPWAESPRIRWWPACHSLAQALAVAQPDGLADVAWVQAGWQGGLGWRRLLQQALAHDAAIGAVGALCLNDAARSPWPARLLRTPDQRRKAALAAPELSAWLSQHASDEPLDLGGWPEEAGVMRASVARLLTGAVGPSRLDPEAQAPEQLGSVLASEATLVAYSARVLVWRAHLGLAAGDEPSPPAWNSLLAEPEMWQTTHPLNALRAAVQAQMVQGFGPASSGPREPQTAPAAPRRAVRLHVAHSWGGGLSKWVREFIRTDHEAGTGQGLVLRSVGVFGAFGQRLCLYAGEEEVVPLRYWELGVPVHATATGHLQVRRILREIIEDYQVDQVLVSSLIGHSVDVLRTGLPTVVVAHDHYPFCVTLYAHFEGECRTCDRSRLAQCLSHNPAHRFFGGMQADDWMNLRAAFEGIVAAQHLPIVAPTPSVAARWQSMMPGLSASQFRVIEHGLDLPAAPDFTPDAQGRLRVLVLGRLSPEKGVDVLLQMLEPLLAFADLLLVGCGERLDPAFKRPGVTTVPDFDNPSLPATLAELKPHVGLLMSTVPETFSYTLSELRHVGIPVVATASGALADRIEDGVSGYLVPAQAQAVLERLSQLNGARDELQRMRRHLLSLPTRSLNDMLLDYQALWPNLPVAHPAQGSQGAHGVQGAQAKAPIQVHAARPAYSQALLVSPQVTWLQAARGFLHYTFDKAARSPRLPYRIKRWLAGRLQR